jgi:hypothetical protein
VSCIFYSDSAISFKQVKYGHGVYKDMSSFLAHPSAPRIAAQRPGGGGRCGVSANEYTGAKINFGDLTPCLTYEYGIQLIGLRRL